MKLRPAVIPGTLLDFITQAVVEYLVNPALYVRMAVQRILLITVMCQLKRGKDRAVDDVLTVWMIHVNKPRSRRYHVLVEAIVHPLHELPFIRKHLPTSLIDGILRN